MKIESYKVRGETRYRFRAYVGIDSATGQPIRVRGSGYETRHEAQLACAELIAREKPVKSMTYGNLYRIWLESYRLTVKDSTLRHVEQVFRDHILPTFGSMQLKDITPLMVQRWVNEQAQSAVKANERLMYFAKIADYAVKNDIIDKNPAEVINRPHRSRQAVRREINYYTREELERFLQLAEERLPHMWYVFFRLLAYTGMRRGETLALTWDDVDPDAMTVRISKTLTRGFEGAYISSTPKTDRSNRTILIDPETMRLMQTLDHSGRYVFSNSKGSFYAQSLPVKMMHKVVDGTDLKYISPHGLRHTHCSLLFSAGVSIPEVQDRLGHADVKTTIDVYNHVYQQDKQNALNRFMDYMTMPNLSPSKR